MRCRPLGNCSGSIINIFLFYLPVLHLFTIFYFTTSLLSHFHLFILLFFQFSTSLINLSFIFFPFLFISFYFNFNINSIISHLHLLSLPFVFIITSFLYKSCDLNYLSLHFTNYFLSNPFIPLIYHGSFRTRVGR
jgi:hypothetical protein